MYLTPNTLSDSGNVCPSATPSCIENCLYTAGRGMMTSVMQARTRKTRLYFDDNAKFIKMLEDDLMLFSKYCDDNGITNKLIRLNGTSDLDWIDVISKFKDITFYDYTKVKSRLTDKRFQLDNYHLTFSRDENTTDEDISNAISNNINVAVVFTEIPVVWKEYKVVSGDLSDTRPFDEKGVIVGLKPKGKLRTSVNNNTDQGFVVRI